MIHPLFQFPFLPLGVSVSKETTRNNNTYIFVKSYNILYPILFAVCSSIYSNVILCYILASRHVV
jgi:hypothetical protein